MGYRHPAVMRADNDLDALRDRDDFRKLIADLETSQNASGGGARPARRCILQDRPMPSLDPKQA